MADRVRVKVLGERQLVAGSKTLFGRIGREAPQAFERFADDVAGQVRGRLPHRTGRLAGRTRAKRRGSSALIQMGDGVRYAQFVEYGGRGFPRSARGNFLGPAADAAEPRLIDVAEEVAHDEVGGMHWPRPR